MIASDGFNTSMATSDLFTLPNHAPMVTIQGLTPGQRVPFSSTTELDGLALDAEDGSVSGSNLVWTLTGPTPLSDEGNSFSARRSFAGRLYSPPGRHRLG